MSLGAEKKSYCHIKAEIMKFMKKCNFILTKIDFVPTNVGTKESFKQTIFLYVFID
jgi:hypothetical protein